MILSLRRRHRQLLATLGLLVPLAFVWGITARKPVPPVSDLPQELLDQPQAFASTQWERDDLFSKSPVQVRLLREGPDRGRFAVQFCPVKELVKPDLIVYWIARQYPISNGLPEEAILLGAISARSLLLPEGVASEMGTLVLYSLADHEVVDTSKSVKL